MTHPRPSSALIGSHVDPGRPNLSGRVPWKLIRTRDGDGDGEGDGEGTLRISWLHLGHENLRDPFFEETAARCLSLPENARPLPTSSLDELLEEAGALPEDEVAQPSGFIFHISRCGSTLLSQMLAVDSRHAVLSEVPFLDAILRLPRGSADARPAAQVEMFQAAVRLLGRRRRGTEAASFVKLDSWHTLLFPTIRAAFPDVPALLLYRAPGEVLRSHQKQPGMHAVPGLIEPELFGFDPAGLAGLTLDAYLERVLVRYFHEYLRILETDRNAWPVSYHDGPSRMVREALRRARLSVSDETWAAMNRRAGWHAKDPQRLFAQVAPDCPQTLADSLFRRLDLLKTGLQQSVPDGPLTK